MIRRRTSSFPVSHCALICSSLGFGGPAHVFGQGLEYIKANYTKYEYRIPMRDGIHLFTSVYVPKDQSQRYPIMLSSHALQRAARTAPTRTRATWAPRHCFGREGYIVAYQDVRGRYMSEGEFVNMRPHRPQKSSPKDIDESSDTFDTIDWLIKNVPG